jgi:DNA-binding protein HU-beta
MGLIQEARGKESPEEWRTSVRPVRRRKPMSGLLFGSTHVERRSILMAKAMTKSEVAATIAEKVGITKKQVNQFFEAQSELAYKQAKNTFVVPGIGKLVLAKSAPREMMMRFGPKAGQIVKVPAKTRVKFRIAKAAKDAILGVKK